MKYLIIEDDNYKAEHLRNIIKDNFNEVNIETKTAYKSGLTEALREKYDLILLDMSMLTFDISEQEKGGRPRHFAGKEIILQMKRRQISTPTIVITQFENFGEGNEKINLDDLTKQLEDIGYVGYQKTIFYNMAQDRWKDELIEIINNIKEGI
jgi:DNA-binding NarL/FixJ family response regulator